MIITDPKIKKVIFYYLESKIFFREIDFEYVDIQINLMKDNYFIKYQDLKTGNNKMIVLTQQNFITYSRLIEKLEI